jgi:transposase
MDATETLKNDLREGRFDADRLIAVIDALQRQLRNATQRIAELEKLLPNAPTAKVDEAFSLRAEEKRQEARGQVKPKGSRKRRRGRIASEEKIKLAVRTETVFPEGVDPNECRLSHVRPVWRIESGVAVLVAYEIYRSSKKQYGKIPGVIGRSEFGMEIVVELAFLVYTMGQSFDKACILLNFFQNLKLKKSQADALLHQLSRHWENEFETLCTLLANSLIVHADETSWSIRSVWAFLSEKARIVFFGVNKDAETLKKILDPAKYKGLIISDDAAVYENFTNSQKCWAHLLRKAIKLTLQDPSNEEYRTFADWLLAIFREAGRVQEDKTLDDARRVERVAELDDEILDLCCPFWRPNMPPLDGLSGDFGRLVNEIMRIAVNNELFPFVTTPRVKQPNGEVKSVGGTNNEAERGMRPPSEARKTGRTSKTMVGARRQTILTSVLESLRLYLKSFTLANVIAEVERWSQQGKSAFEQLVAKLKIRPPDASILDQIFPKPSG